MMGVGDQIEDMLGELATNWDDVIVEAGYKRDKVRERVADQAPYGLDDDEYADARELTAQVSSKNVVAFAYRTDEDKVTGGGAAGPAYDARDAPEERSGLPDW